MSSQLAESSRRCFLIVVVLFRVSTIEYCMNRSERQACWEGHSFCFAESQLDEFLIFEPLGLIRIDSKSFPPLSLVGFVVPFAPMHVTITFKGQDVCG